MVNGIFVGTSENNFGFCHVSGKLVDTGAFLEAANTQSLPQLGVSVSLEELVGRCTDTDRLPQRNAGKLAVFIPLKNTFPFCLP